MIEDSVIDTTSEGIREGVIGDVIFDLQDPDFWLLRYSIPRFEAMMGYAIIGFSIALVVFIFGPLIPALIENPNIDLKDLGAILFLSLLTLAIVAAGRYAIRSADEKILRLTDQGFVVSIYKTVPYSRLKDIVISKYHDTRDMIRVVYRDDDGSKKEASEVHTGRELDIIGMVDAFERMVPYGPQPNVREFLSDLKDAPDSRKVTEYRQWRAHRYEKNLMSLALMYMSLFIVPLMAIAFYEYGVDVQAVSATITAVIIYACVSLVVIADLAEMVNPFLDSLEKDFSIRDERAIIPRPFMSRLPLTIRRSISLDEIREVRPHCMLSPRSFASLVIDMRGRGFIVPKGIMDQLECDTRFKRVGWKLVNMNPAPQDEGPIARWDWWKIRFILIVPALVYILTSLYVAIT